MRTLIDRFYVVRPIKDETGRITDVVLAVSGTHSLPGITVNDVLRVFPGAKV